MEISAENIVGLKASWCRYRLNFKFEAITSRSRMTFKDTYFLKLSDSKTGTISISEVPYFDGLSAETRQELESAIASWCRKPSTTIPMISSLRFGIESGLCNLYDSSDTPFFKGEEGIPINGLIWMGDRQLMRERIDAKLKDGFKVLKLKIGGIDFIDELELLKYIRSLYSPDDLELRLDANGSFSPDSALDKLNRLSEYHIHSIEQPIKAGQPYTMGQICRESPISIALDEELIGCHSKAEIKQLLDIIKPSYIILKPALCGGFNSADLWIEEATNREIGWWATSALESNVGLKAIAQWLTSKYIINMPQGLGTGQLYHNNFDAGLYLVRDRLFCNPEASSNPPSDSLQWQQ